ncbi:type III-D CRISPR-associated protein Csx19 [Scytonema sp. PRP1]|uniref:type III-D CRISPR-associated protein Csx19 n=1 Tax=Scytonema sp. PRP1 TaxID=3120513 RepID=UPI002FD12B59
MMTTLYGRISNNITLQAALKNCAVALFSGSQAVALLYSPTCCQFAIVQPNGDLTDANNQSLDLKNVFEARAFNQTCELRWLNELDGKGRAVLISEQDIAGYLSEDISDLKALDTISQSYILWGKGVKSVLSPGWGKLAAARIGSISVPVTGLSTDKQRVYLKSIEYLKDIDDYGNFAVVEERLIGLEVKSWLQVS